MTWSWEEAWDVINESFGRLAADLSSHNPKLWWSCGHSDNEAFPFWAFASFNKAGVAGEEDVVVSLSFKRSDGMLEFTSDLARGDGELLAEGPTGSTRLADDVATIREWIHAQTEAGLRFVWDHLDLLQTELC